MFELAACSLCGLLSVPSRLLATASRSVALALIPIWDARAPFRNCVDHDRHRVCGGGVVYVGEHVRVARAVTREKSR